MDTTNVSQCTEFTTLLGKVMTIIIYVSMIVAMDTNTPMNASYALF